MGLSAPTIQKLMRESFSGEHPMVLAPAERAGIAADLRERLSRIDGIETTETGYVEEREKPRFVCQFELRNPDRSYYYYRDGATFQLVLDEKSQLTVRPYYREAKAIVSDLEEVVNFARVCRQRLDRKRALRAKRGKVRDLLTQAIVAHVRKLAKEHRFDFAFDPDDLKLNLYVRLSGNNALQLRIPFKKFKEHLPQLGPAINSLRDLYEGGFRFQVTGRRIRRRDQEWIKHETL